MRVRVNVSCLVFFVFTNIRHRPKDLPTAAVSSIRPTGHHGYYFIRPFGPIGVVGIAAAITAAAAAAAVLAAFCPAAIRIAVAPQHGQDNAGERRGEGRGEYHGGRRAGLSPVGRGMWPFLFECYPRLADTFSS